VRAAYAALVLGIVGGLGLATAVLSGVRPPVTIAAALGVDDGPDLDSRRATAVAALTTACMRRHGLDWAAVPESLPTVPDASLDPIAWADRWGFGIATMAGMPATSAAPDQNLEALGRMPGPAQAVVRAALHGTVSDRGCAEQATQEVYGLRDRALAPLRPAFEELTATIDIDPRVVAAVATWRGCVAPVSSGLAAERRTLAGALLERAVARLDDVRAGRADLGSAQREERQDAGMLARCEAAFTDVRARVAQRYEAPFVSRYRAQLASIGATIKAAEAAWPSAAP
jgi:hypothetical protein